MRISDWSSDVCSSDLYDIVESNRPTNDPENVLNTVQTGEIRSRGFELEGAVAVADDFLVTAAYSHNDATVTESNFAPEVGQRLSDVPRDTAAGWGTKRIHGGDEKGRRRGGSRSDARRVRDEGGGTRERWGHGS